ncbi:aminotransferase class I/II [Streptomyces inusitatus]|uniref:Aminotransferase class I/II n=1 Tax=Streptomyces inusitatus TaxID=68221 RepID=A0A918PXP8_9ACTN|nr:enduracididine biosynthesis enzyme MppQ [Streptomyces inusitatus]GGZ26569.1 aminotransferase class I/II [Streptomyces inusitatus]
MTASAPEEGLPHGSAPVLPHTRRWRAGVVQEVAPPGVLDLGPGYIEPALLPVRLMAGAYQNALAEYGAAALSYGHDPGALPLRSRLAARATAADGRLCEPEQILLTSGTSQALYLLATALAAPGDTVLTEEFCYDLGQRIFLDCALRLRQVAMDASGMLPEALDQALTEGAQAGTTTAFVYLTPTHHNPLGHTMPSVRRRQLIEVAAHHGVMMVEDDAYAELSLSPEPPPPSLAALAGYRRVVRLCSFSKTLGPGLRLGWLLADRETAGRLSGHGLFASGGSLNHTTSLAVDSLLADGAYDRHLGVLREQLRIRRDALEGALRAALGDRWALRTPSGGFFLWLRGERGTGEAELLAGAAGAGVRIAAGSRFGVPRPGAAAVRLAFSFNPPESLERAAVRLAAAWSGSEPAPEIGVRS